MGWYLFFAFPFLSFLCLFLLLFFFFTMTLSILAGADVGTKELEPTIAEEAKGLAPRVQTTEAQTGIP